MTSAQKIAAIALNLIIPFLGNLSFSDRERKPVRYILLFAVFCALYWLVDDNDLILGRFFVSGLYVPVTIVVMLGFAWSSILVLRTREPRVFDVRVLVVGLAIVASGWLFQTQLPSGSRVAGNTLAPFVEADDFVTYRDLAPDWIGGLRLAQGSSSWREGEQTVGFVIAGPGDIAGRIEGMAVICSTQEDRLLCRQFLSVCDFLAAEPWKPDSPAEVDFRLGPDQIIVATMPPLERMTDSESTLRILALQVQTADRIYVIDRKFRSGTYFSTGEVVPSSGCPTAR